MRAGLEGRRKVITIARLRGLLWRKGNKAIAKHMNKKVIAIYQGVVGR